MTTQNHYKLRDGCYTGCYIPNAVWKGESSCDCIGIMLEHHKRIYCDEQGRSAPEKLAKIRAAIQQIIVDYAVFT